jgi:hypothetical protein
MDCHVGGGSYRPTQSWPYDTIAMEVSAGRPCTGGMAPSCTDVLPKYVGAVVTADATTIAVDMYGSDGSLPAGVPVLATPLPDQFVVSVPLQAGPLAAGSYAVVIRVHSIDAQGAERVCTAPPTPYPILIRKVLGPVERLTAIEFYNAALDHYFITVNPAEIADLDRGVHPGWSRTGGSFNVFAPGKSGGSGVPVCRFYGQPSAGLDSHFYTASASECADIPTKFKGAWQLETSNAFEIWLPTAAGNCEDLGAGGVMRLWNQRTDSNHRFTADGNVFVDMLRRGYVLEGFGEGTPIAMCTP